MQAHHERHYALDVLRGLTIALMIIVNNPGDWNHMFAVLRHADWHGFSGADIVFPLFLFVAGFAAELKLSRIPETLTRGITPPTMSRFFATLLRRSTFLFLVGVFLNAWPFGLLPGTEFSWHTVRVFGVLQRIALCVLLGGILLYSARSWRSLLIVILAVALIYECIMRVPLVQFGPESFGRSFELKNNFARFVDMSILPSSMLYKVHGVTFDPEGLVGTLGALLSFLLGAVAFRFDTLWPQGKRSFFTFAILLALVGFLLRTLEPVNKHLWTLSYVGVTGAVGVFLLFCLRGLNSHPQWVAHRVLRPFADMGINPLFLYVLSVLIGKTVAVWKAAPNFSLKQFVFAALTAVPLDEKLLSLFYSLLLLLPLLIFARAMRKKPISL